MVSTLKNSMKFLLFSASLMSFQGLLRADDFLEDGSDASSDVWVDPVDTTEEDLVVPSLQSGAVVDEQADPKFVAFLADVGGRLTLPQTYHSALSDLVISVRNDQMWKGNPTMRRAMLSLLHRAEIYGRRNGGVDLPAVDQIVREAFELWPPGPDRPRIVGLMNSVSSFQERQIALAQAAQDKADAAAAKEAARAQAAQDKADQQAAKEAAAAAAAAKNADVAQPKAPKAPSSRAGRKPKATPQQDAVNAPADPLASQDDFVDTVTTRKPRMRKKASAAQDSTQDFVVVPDAPTVDVPVRIDHIPNIAPADAGSPGDAANDTSTAE